jgi:arsenate reductase
MIEIWHNPRCSKSRASMEIVESSKQEFSVKKYLDETPKYDEIKDILKKLDISARELMRTKEDIYVELGVKNITDEDKLIEIMSQHPVLIERPIIIKGDRAVIGRPMENTIELLGS